jgi:hypothetical protein
MDLIPSSGPHWHLLLNHFPSIGTVIALGFLLAGLYRKSAELTRASLVLFVILALLTIPAYVSGAAARGAILGEPGVSADYIAAHMEAASFAFMALLIAGWLSWFALWQDRRFSRLSPRTVLAVMAFGIVALGLMVVTGNLGGHINHAEIRAGEELAAGSGGPIAAIANGILDSAWAWPSLEAAHFLGMAVLFGVVLLIVVRVLGLAKNVPFTAVHRLLPLGVFGFMINVMTGMLFFVADHERYITMTNSFFPKMGLIVIGGIAVLYFTIVDKPWELKPGDDAPIAAKFVALATVLAWSGVLIYGRLLPYLEGAGG